ncbi:MAG TPA: hypothetical protein VK742_06815 [Candidatus Sulfotelmatobacter sp.]|nr:hypothetical protein [Candidatus Sulfotelmatobacter sp.]
MNSQALLIAAIGVAALILIRLAIFRWLIPWYADRTVENLLRDIKEGKPGISQNTTRDYLLELTFDDTGFKLASLKQKEETPIFILWNEIVQATAFKRDLFTVDCICLLIKNRDSKELELNEDMKGWPEFIESLEKFLPKSKPFSEWLFQVASPAFEANPTEIFSKP